MQRSLILPVWDDVIDICILQVVWVSGTKRIPLGLDHTLVRCTCILNLDSDSRTPPLRGFHGKGDRVSLRPAVRGAWALPVSVCLRPGLGTSLRDRCVPQRGGPGPEPVPVPSMLAAVRATWAATRRAAAATFANTQEGDAIPSTRPAGWGALSPQCTSMSIMIALAGSDLSLGTGSGPAPRRPHRHRSRPTTSFSRRLNPIPNSTMPALLAWS